MHAQGAAPKGAKEAPKSAPAAKSTAKPPAKPESAATAAVIAINDRIPVQDVPYEKLRARLVADGQALEFAAKTGNR